MQIVATHGEARRAKERALDLRPREGEYQTTDRERRAVVFMLNVREVGIRVWKQWWLEAGCRKRGMRVKMISNTRAGRRARDTDDDA